MKIIKHGRTYIDKEKTFVLKCDCDCEFETCIDECELHTCATFNGFVLGVVEERHYSKCPECGRILAVETRK